MRTVTFFLMGAGMVLVLFILMVPIIRFKTRKVLLVAAYAFVIAALLVAVLDPGNWSVR